MVGVFPVYRALLTFKPCPGAPNSPTRGGAGRVGWSWAGGPLLPTDRPSSWPFKREEHSALAWWRTLPADSIHGADRRHLLATLRQISVLHGLQAALRGETDGAIGAALAAMPVSAITFRCAYAW